MAVPRWLSGKESACNAGNTEDRDSVIGLGRSPGGVNGNLLQYSCQDRGAWQATVHGITELDSTSVMVLYRSAVCTCTRPHWQNWQSSITEKNQLKGYWKTVIKSMCL